MGDPDWLTDYFAARADMRLPLFGQPALTDEQLDHLKAEWRRKMQDGTFGRPRLLTPLPRRVRLRLAVRQAINGVGIWLCGHRMWRAADLLWWRR